LLEKSYKTNKYFIKKIICALHEKYYSVVSNFDLIETCYLEAYKNIHATLKTFLSVWQKENVYVKQCL